MKKCFKCEEEKPLSKFYKHPQTTDGHLGKCKACCRQDATDRRNSDLEHYRKYDRNRKYRNRNIKEYRANYPRKYKATNMISNAKKRGYLHEEPCEVCGSTLRLNAHHDDYSKPLNIRWLCSVHHHQWHRENGEGLNG